MFTVLISRDGEFTGIPFVETREGLTFNQAMSLIDTLHGHADYAVFRNEVLVDEDTVKDMLMEFWSELQAIHDTTLEDGVLEEEQELLYNDRGDIDEPSLYQLTCEAMESYTDRVYESRRDEDFFCE